MLAEEFKSTLLGDIARLLELLESLEARGVFTLRNDATLLGLHQILLGQATGSVLGSSVPDLRLGARSHHSTTLLLLLLVLLLVLASVLYHFYTSEGEIKTLKVWVPCLYKFLLLGISFSGHRRLLQNERGNLQVPTKAHSAIP